jgi:hypothetical protein
MKAGYMLHENGLRVNTDELGWFMVLFDDFEKIVFTSGVEL